MSDLGNAGFLRLKQIVGDLKADPPITPIIPVSRNAWLEGVKAGTYPPPIKLSPNVTAWRASDIRRLIADGRWTPDAV